MDISHLERSVQELFTAGLAESTRKSYKTGANSYLSFCATYGRVNFPVTEKNLSLFSAHLSNKGLQASTVKSYLAAVRHTQIALGLGDPKIGDMPQLEYVLKGLKRKTTRNGTRTRLPITPIEMRILKQVWESQGTSHDTAMLWAASSLCFFGFLRSGEAVAPSESSYDPQVHLLLSDVRIDSRTDPQVMEVRIKASKTDPFRKGVTLHLGRTGMDLCPLSAVLGYLSFRGGGDGPLFRFKNGKFLTRERLVTELRRALEAGGIAAAQYAGHSFRIGAATSAAEAGISDALIKTLGRWQSSAYTLYIRTPPAQLRAASCKMVMGQKGIRKRSGAS